MIVFNRACLDGRESVYLNQAIAGEHVSGSGAFSRRDEDLVAGIHAGSRVLLTTSCTHAFELAAHLLDFQPGDEVIVP